MPAAVWDSEVYELMKMTPPFSIYCSTKLLGNQISTNAFFLTTSFWFLSWEGQPQTLITRQISHLGDYELISG